MIVGRVFGEQVANSSGDGFYRPMFAHIVRGSVKVLNQLALVQIASVNGVAFASVRLVDGMTK